MAAYNGTKIVQNGLVLLVDAANPKSYNVGITSTAWNNLIGSGNTATLVGGVGYEDKNGGILRLDGVNDYAIAARPGSIVTGGPISVCIWAKWTTVGTGISTIQVLVDNAHSGIGVGFVIQDRPDISKKIQFSSYPTSDGAVSTFQVGDGRWHYIVGTNDQTTTNLYIDGILNSSASQQGLAPVQSNITFGSWQSGPSRYLNGNIAQSSIYNRALTAAEVLQNYNALKFRFVQPPPKVVDDGLILYLDAADVDSYPAFGTIWTDLSGRGNNGTLDNGVGYSNEFGGALTFDGVNDSVTIADNFDFRNTFPSGNFTLTSVSKSTDTTTYPKSSHPFWIQTYVLNNAGAIANKGMSSADGSNATSFGIEVNDGGNYFIGYINHIVNVSTVYHRSFVVDRSNGFALRYYVNGNLLGEIKSASVTGTIYTTGGMSFGNMYGWMFNGSLYRLSVHNKALTSTEVLQNYNAVKGKFGI